jgi:hypothetical protein
MELTKDRPSAGSEREALLNPSTLDANQERQELQSLVASAPPVESCTSRDIVATAIPISSFDAFQDNDLPIATATALPVTHHGVNQTIQSSSNNQKDVKQEQITVSPLPLEQELPTNHPHNLPTASPIRTYTTPTTEQQTTATLLRQAQHRGFIESEIERTQDTFAKTSLDNIRKDTAAALRIAQLNALKSKRSDEGLTVDEGVHSNCSTTAIPTTYTANAEEEYKRPFGTIKDGKRGYEVNEYEVGEYDTKEYDVAEYKSLYD